MRSQLKKERGKIFLPHRDLNHGPQEPGAGSVAAKELQKWKEIA